jgi:ParB family transcriptional regulator, chromosome partitioning protein
MPADVKNLCRLADISSKSLLLQIVRLGDHAKMIAMIEKIAREGNATREKLRKEAAARPQRGRPRAYVFNYRPPTKAFKLHLAFAKSQVDRGEIISALEAIIQELRKGR